MGSAEEEGAARLGDLLEGVVPEAVRKVYRERRAKAQGAKRAVAKAERAVESAQQAVAAAGAQTTLPALPVPEVPLEAVRSTYASLLREPEVVDAIRSALLKPGDRNKPALLRALLEFVGGEVRGAGAVNVTLVSRIPRPEKAIDVTPTEATP